MCAHAGGCSSSRPAFALQNPALTRPTDKYTKNPTKNPIKKYGKGSHQQSACWRSVSDGADPLSEAEMDVHTIRHMREAAAAEGHPPKALVHLSPEDSLATALRRLLDSQTSMAPVLSPDPQGTALAASHTGRAAKNQFGGKNT